MVGVSTSRRDQGVGRPAPGCPGEALSPDRAALSVLAGGGVVTIRGEVRSLDQISRASRVIDGFGGDTEIVNLVRLRGTAIGAGSG
jgi:osmotically-inducible protein OsmY